MYTNGRGRKINKRKKNCLGIKGFTLGELILVFAFVFVLVVLMSPFIRQMLKRTDRISCDGNLREIGRGLYIYAREHEGKFPPTLKTLYAEQYLADPRLMDCPANKEIGTPEAPDYIYTGGLSVRSPSGDPLVRDKAKNHLFGGKNIVFVNGDLEWED